MNASLLGFEFELLVVAGFAPSLRQCSGCGEDASEWIKFRMSRNGDGLLCESCASRQKTGVVDRDAMKILWFLSDHEMEEPPPAALIEKGPLAQARRVIWASLARVVDYELKSMPMLEQFLEVG